MKERREKRKIRRKHSGSDSNFQSNKQYKPYYSPVIEKSPVNPSASESVLGSLEQLQKKGLQRESSENMATSEPKSSSLKEIYDQMKLVLSTVTEIKSNQDSMRLSFDSKLDKIRNEFMATIDGKLRTL